MTTTPTTGAPAMTRRQLLVLVLLLASQFMLAVDFSILNVALPAVGSALGFATANLQWIATAFALCAAGFTLLFGRIGDYVGRRRVFLVGMAALGIASLVGGLATDPAMLLLARVGQGLATAAVTPAGLSLLTTSFPEGPLRARALGLNSIMMSTGFTAGALVGGLLTDLLDWRWAFLVNVPVAVAVLAVAPFLLRETAGRQRTALDVPGSVLVTVGLLALVYGVTRAGEAGIGDPWVVVAIVGAVLALAAFVWAEGRHPHPLVPLQILRRHTIAWGNIAGFATIAMESSLVFLLTMYLQHVLRLDAMQTGLALGVLGLGAIVGGWAGPRVIAAFGPGRVLAAALAVQALFTAVLICTGIGPGAVWLVAVCGFLGGIGHMVAIVGFMVSATSGMPDAEQGLAAGVATMTQQVAMAMGVPIMSAVATAAGSLTDPTALRTAVGVNAAVVAVVAVLIGLAMRTRTPAAVQAAA